MPITWTGRPAGGRLAGSNVREYNMGKGNNSQKNDKKGMKPKQDKAKPAAKK
jgi:hypothetical protein